MANEMRLDLINRRKLLAEMDKFANPMPNQSGHDFLCGIATAITEIEDAPTVDAVEVVHGRWIHVDDEEYECNQCRNHACFDEQLDMSVPAYNYCPNCGAKMDGSKDNSQRR